MKNKLAILRQHILFKNTGNNFLDIIKYLDMYIVNYQKNEIISNAGGKIDFMGVVVKGSAYISLTDLEGNRMILREIQEGHSFGETISLAGVENIITIIATTHTSIAYLSLRKIIDDRPFICDRIIKNNLLELLAQKNVALLMKNDIISKKTIRERLMAYFFYHCQVLKTNIVKTTLSQEELSDYLCVNRSALSRELKKMIKENIIGYQKKQFVIKNINFKQSA